VLAVSRSRRDAHETASRIDADRGPCVPQERDRDRAANGELPRRGEHSRRLQSTPAEGRLQSAPNRSPQAGAGLRSDGRAVFVGVGARRRSWKRVHASEARSSRGRRRAKSQRAFYCAARSTTAASVLRAKTDRALFATTHRRLH
jgi:hypothetical protein